MDLNALKLSPRVCLSLYYLTTFLGIKFFVSGDICYISGFSASNPALSLLIIVTMTFLALLGILLFKKAHL